MTTPIIADTCPAKVTLKANRYYFFCTCGRSQDQPFCDGAHKGSDLLPMTFKCDQETEAYLCQCKLSSNLPYCDGTHKTCDAELRGKPVTDANRP